MRIHVICRLNQARSIITAAVIRKIYPELRVFSAGIQANTGEPLPTVIAKIAYKWDLQNLDHYSRDLDSSEPIKKGDIVLCADKSIANHLTKLDIPGEIIDVTTFALRDFLVPRDPVQMPFYAMEAEIEKMVVASIRALNTRLKKQPTAKVEALIYSEPSDPIFLETLEDWFKTQNGTAIDMNWRIPDSNIWQERGFHSASFDPRKANNELAPSLSATIYCSKYELDRQSQILTSFSWLEFLNRNPHQYLLLITNDLYGDEVPCAFALSLIHLNKLITLD